MKPMLDRHNEITPDICFGKPLIAGTRLWVGFIAGPNLRGEVVEEIARTYDVTPASVHAAMASYYDHRTAIDARTVAGEAFAEEMRRNSPPSPLQADLDAMC